MNAVQHGLRKLLLGQAAATGMRGAVGRWGICSEGIIVSTTAKPSIPTRVIGPTSLIHNVRSSRQLSMRASHIAPSSPSSSPAHFSAAWRGGNQWRGHRGFERQLSPRTSSLSSIRQSAARFWHSLDYDYNALYLLLGINTSIYVLWNVSGSSRSTFLPFMAKNFVASERSLKDGRVWTLITSAFSHVYFGHLFSNMLALYFFGGSVTRATGGTRLIRLYLVGGLVGSIAHFMQQAYGRQKDYFGRYTTPVKSALGASGAVNAIVCYDILLNPTKMIYVNFFIPMPAWIFGGLFLGRDLIFAYSGTNTGVSHGAHIGGAAAGAFLFWLTRGRRLPFR